MRRRASRHEQWAVQPRGRDKEKTSGMTDHDEEGRERLDEVAEETSSGMSDHEEEGQEEYWNRTRIEKNYQKARGGRATSRRTRRSTEGVRCSGTGFLGTSLISESPIANKRVVDMYNSNHHI